MPEKKDSKKGKNESLILKQSIAKEENKDKILDYLKNNPNPTDGQVNKITNNDVEKITGVSDSTATRYLEELEQEGKINQIGKTGHYVYYQLK